MVSLITMMTSGIASWRAAAPCTSERSGTRSVLERFVYAIQMQDKTALPEPAGGKTRAAVKLIRGRGRVVRFALDVLGRHWTGSR
jgi:hypothetical protein